MAEIGIVASIVQIADTGLRLSLKLYTFGEIVSTADKSIISISKDVSLTSSVLKELGDILEKDQRSRICSKNAVQTANGIVQECLGVFEEMERVLFKKLPHLASKEGEKAKRAVMVLERLKWPYLQPKLELMRCNLEKLKSTLNLMLNVITLARQQNSRTESPTAIEQQKTLVEDLAKSNVDYGKRLEQMQLSVDASQSTQSREKDASTTSLSSIYSGATSTGNGLLNNLKYNPKASSSLSEDTFISAKREGPESDASGFPSLLLSQHHALLEALLQEVDAPKYQISFESRFRIKRNAITSHNQEIDHAIVKHYSSSIQMPYPQNLAPKYLQTNNRKYFAQTAQGSTTTQNYPGETNSTPSCSKQQSTSTQNVRPQEFLREAEAQLQQTSPKNKQYHPPSLQQMHQQTQQQQRISLPSQYSESYSAPADTSPHHCVHGATVSSEPWSWQEMQPDQQQRALVDQAVTMSASQEIPTPPGISRSELARGQKRSRSPEFSELNRSSPRDEGLTQRDGTTVKTIEMVNPGRDGNRRRATMIRPRLKPLKAVSSNLNLPRTEESRVVDDLLALWTLPMAQEATDRGSYMTQPINRTSHGLR